VPHICDLVGDGLTWTAFGGCSNWRPRYVCSSRRSSGSRRATHVA